MSAFFLSLSFKLNSNPATHPPVSKFKNSKQFLLLYNNIRNQSVCQVSMWRLSSACSSSIRLLNSLSAVALSLTFPFITANRLEIYPRISSSFYCCWLLLPVDIIEVLSCFACCPPRAFPLCAAAFSSLRCNWFYFFSFLAATRSTFPGAVGVGVFFPNKIVRPSVVPLGDFGDLCASNE